MRDDPEPKIPAEPSTFSTSSPSRGPSRPASAASLPRSHQLSLSDFNGTWISDCGPMIIEKGQVRDAGGEVAPLAMTSRGQLELRFAGELWRSSYLDTTRIEWEGDGGTWTRVDPNTGEEGHHSARRRSTSQPQFGNGDVGRSTPGRRNSPPSHDHLSETREYHHHHSHHRSARSVSPSHGHDPHAGSAHSGHVEHIGHHTLHHAPHHSHRDHHHVYRSPHLHQATLPVGSGSMPLHSLNPRIHQQIPSPWQTHQYTSMVSPSFSQTGWSQPLDALAQSGIGAALHAGHQPTPDIPLGFGTTRLPMMRPSFEAQPLGSVSFRSMTPPRTLGQGLLAPLGSFMSPALSVGGQPPSPLSLSSMPLGDASSRQVAELQAQVERLSKTVTGLQGEISHLQGSRDDSRRDNGKLDISPLSQQDHALFDTPLGQSIHNPR